MEFKRKLILFTCLSLFGLNSIASILIKDTFRFEYYNNTSDLNNCDSLFLGFAPISTETFKPLLKVVGNCSIDTTSTLKILLNDISYIISTESGDTISSSTHTIDLEQLLSTLGSPINKYNTLRITGDSFSPDFIRFVNPSVTTTLNSHLTMGGVWTFSEFPLWNYRLNQDAYVSLESGKAVLPDFEESISLHQLKHTGATFDSLTLSLSHKQDSIFNITGSGILKFGDTRFVANLGKNNSGGIQLTNGKPDTISVIVTDSFKIGNLRMQCNELAIDYVLADSSYSLYGDSLKVLFNSNKFILKPGDKNNPGANFTNNTSQSMFCTSIDTTSIFGVKLTGENITLEYQNTDFVI